ncbi:MAG: ABC transporter substrate-binding protein [Candidatus Latescibacteria bacterium]|nr:ABC transporter substrate-binding protein [Candidatus Latescibacterota bacterium]
MNRILSRKLGWNVLWLGLVLGWGGAAGTVELVDDLGVPVSLEAPPQRIISLAPSNTELVFALGLGPRLVGVTDVCNYPPQASDIDKVAGYNYVNIEEIVARKPDLVLAIRGNDMEGVQLLRQQGIPVFAFEIQSVEQTLSSIGRLGQLAGVEAVADSLQKALQKRLDMVAAQVDTAASRPRIMWGYWGETIYTAGSDTFIDDVFHRAGGDNVGGKAPGAWPQVSLEALVDWAPQIVITTYLPKGGDMNQELVQLRQRSGWQLLPAVRDGRVYHVDGDLLLRPGPRVIDALEQIATMVRASQVPSP